MGIEQTSNELIQQNTDSSYPVGAAPRIEEPSLNYDDHYWMARALDCARKAEAIGEVPVGAIVVKDNQLVAEGWNQCITHSDPSAHAEIVAIRAAAKRVGNYRLPGAELYVTLEPCTMCVGAMVHARIQRLIYATQDPKTGVVDTVDRLTSADYHNHKIQITSGIYQSESAQLLKDFFQSRRRKP